MILIFLFLIVYHLVQIINPRDSTILYNQLDDLHNKHPLLFNKNKILIADAVYDSQKLRVQVDELNLGKLLTHKNRRNCKQKEIKDIYKMDEYLLLNNVLMSNTVYVNIKNIKDVN